MPTKRFRHASCRPLSYADADETVPAMQDNGLPIVSPTPNTSWPGHAHLLWMATDKAAGAFAKTAGQKSQAGISAPISGREG